MIWPLSELSGPDRAMVSDIPRLLEEGGLRRPAYVAFSYRPPLWCTLEAAIIEPRSIRRRMVVSDGWRALYPAALFSGLRPVFGPFAPTIWYLQGSHLGIFPTK